MNTGRRPFAGVAMMLNMAKGTDGSDGSVPRARQRELQQALAIPDLTERLLEVAAIISSELAAVGVQSVLVGGLAVAYWTDAEFTSTDIDMLAPSSEVVAERLAALGFHRQGRMWVAPDETLVLEAPGTAPAPGAVTVEVDLESGRSLVVLSLEDVLLDRLHQFRSGGHSDVYEQTIALLAIPELDRERLDARARSEGLEGALARVEEAHAAFVERGKLPESWELHELARALP